MDKIFYQLLFFDFGSFFLLINFMARIEILVTKIVRPKNYYYSYYELCYAIFHTHKNEDHDIHLCIVFDFAAGFYFISVSLCVRMSIVHIDVFICNRNDVVTLC